MHINFPFLFLFKKVFINSIYNYNLKCKRLLKIYSVRAISKKLKKDNSFKSCNRCIQVWIWNIFMLCIFQKPVMLLGSPQDLVCLVVHLHKECLSISILVRMEMDLLELLLRTQHFILVFHRMEIWLMN